MISISSAWAADYKSDFVDGQVIWLTTDYVDAATDWIVKNSTSTGSVTPAIDPATGESYTGDPIKVYRVKQWKSRYLELYVTGISSMELFTNCPNQTDTRTLKVTLNETSEQNVINVVTVDANVSQLGSGSIELNPDMKYIIRVFATGDMDFYAIKVSVPASDAPQLSVSTKALSFVVNPLARTRTASFKLMGKNLADGTYNLDIPTVEGLSVEPTSFTVANGEVSQDIAVTYTSEADVEKSTAAITATVGELTATVNVNYQSRAAAYEQTITSEAAEWDWTTLTATVELTDNSIPSKNDEFVFKELEEQINFGSFDAQSIVISKTQYPSRNKKFQNGTIKFKTTQAGLLSVTFSDTGTSGSAYERYLNVQGKNTEYYTMRDGSSDNKKTVSNIYVHPGEVAITGMKDDGVTSAALCVYKVTWTPTELQGTDYCIVGELTGGWPTDQNITDMPMTQSEDNENIYTLVVKKFKAEARTYDYKLRDNYDWDGFTLPDNGNYSWNCTEAGEYNLIFTANIGNVQVGDYAPYSVTLVAERVKYDFPVTFVNGENWAEVYAYAWNGDGDNAELLAGEWPGTQLEKSGTVTIDEVVYDVYAYTYNGVAAPEKIIFNNGGSEQTEDLVFEKGKQYEYFLVLPVVEVASIDALKNVAEPCEAVLTLNNAQVTYAAEGSGSKSFAEKVVIQDETGGVPLTDVGLIGKGASKGSVLNGTIRLVVKMGEDGLLSLSKAKGESLENVTISEGTVEPFYVTSETIGNFTNYDWRYAKFDHCLFDGENTIYNDVFGQELYVIDVLGAEQDPTLVGRYDVEGYQFTENDVAYFQITKIAERKFYIVGDFTGGWDEANDLEMTTADGNIYTATVSDFAAAANTTYEYKLRTNHEWNLFDLPASGNNNWYFDATAAGVYNLNFKANVSAEEVDGLAAFTLTVELVKNTATAIQSVDANAQNAPLYNLNGQRVNRNVKGIVIQNGKKTVLK